MKANIFFAAIAALAVTSCAIKAEQPETLDEQMTIHASMAEQPTDVKSCVQDGGTQVYWEASDEIKVFFKSSSGRFVSQNTALAAAADFQGSLNMLVGANEGVGTSNALWGLYPYRADAEYDGTSVVTTLPSEQTGRAGSFAKNTHITLACSYSHDLAFYNVCSGLRFSLSQEGIKSVTFEGNGGEAIAGTIKLAFENGVPAIKETTDPQTAITLSAPNGGSFKTGKWYYIEALPGTLSSGYKMTFHKDGESAKLTSPSPVSFKRGKYGSLADADEGLIFKPDGGGGEEPDPSDIIQFADPIAKYACIEKFDANGDGEISYGEAAAVTSLSGLFKDWNTVESFDEIKYFTGVTSTEGVFTGLMNLKSITIPDNITSLGTFQGCTSLKTVVLPATLGSLPRYCFDGCTALTAVTLPTGINTIPSFCFRNCSSLETLVLPSTVTYIRESAFSGCSSLAVLDLPSGLQAIENSTFLNCRALASIDMPAALASIGSLAFAGCSSLSAVIMPSSMTYIPDGLFYECSSLSSVIWPSAVTSVVTDAFYGCEFMAAGSKLEIPATVTTIGSRAFRGVRHLVMPSTKAISIAGDSFVVGYTRLYVPAGMVEMYKVRTNWSKFAGAIYPIEDYPATIWTGGGAVGEPVDLGLSVKWASWNVGASKPEDYGAHIAWGETEAQWGQYSWSTYKWCKGSETSFTKYCPSDKTDYWGGTGSPDGKTVLELEDDAARVNWGGSWRMPTDAEWTELRENCTWTWTTQNGVNGRLVTSKTKGNSIFLPAAGTWSGDYVQNAGSRGNYWSSSLNTDSQFDDPVFAWRVSFYSGGVDRSKNGRSYGYSVRPVTE